GAIMASTDKETIIWKVASRDFDIPAFKPGINIRPEGASSLCIQKKQEVSEKIPRSIYGVPLLMTAMPVFDNGEAIQSLCLIFPRFHPIETSFDKFAPIIANMFFEGAFLYMSDLEKITHRQPSEKFDMSDLNLGDRLTQGWVADEAIKSKKLAIKEVDASVHGVPVSIMSNPLFDEDDAGRVIGTLTIALPKNTALKLRGMADNLTRGLEEISAVIEQLAASAGEINVNEQELNKQIEEVNSLADNISEVLAFIKQIADETKMLGLNAAIEAARAGEAGRGFGVVADEIRKLSEESKATVANIKELITKIKDNVAETTRKSELNLHASQEQAAATQEKLQLA
ncbi:MAG: methyl-accepting chemotaxis protein, partial [Syntrophomonadaceae bacterium]